ncbi:MAG: hypothetical protein JW841_16865 [Deltaproteobacteria bacterium]|nr:hypothetical protein [Deltaproteobacteria bacterium]
MKQGKWFISFVFVAMLALPTIALAQSGGSAAFGHPGQVVPFGSISMKYNTAGDGTSEIGINPGLLYFIMDNLAVGGSFKLQRHSEQVATMNGSESSSTTQLGFAPMAAYHLALNPQISLLAQGSLPIIHQFGDFSYTLVQLDIFAPLLLHIAQHFFIGAGPQLAFDLIVPDGADHSVTIGLQTVIGGYFNL